MQQAVRLALVSLVSCRLTVPAALIAGGPGVGSSSRSLDCRARASEISLKQELRHCGPKVAELTLRLLVQLMGRPSQV